MNNIFSSKKLYLFNFLSFRFKIWILRVLSKYSVNFMEFNSALQGVKNILVIMPDTLADNLLLQKVLMSLKTHYNGCNLEVVCRQDFREIIESNEFVDRGIFYLKDEFTFFTPSLKKMCKHIRKQRYDACYLLDYSQNLVKLFIAGISRAAVRIGFDKAAVAPFINIRIKPDPERINRREIY
jgi:ADP-heptose:LPS heptosyltransferase